MADYIEDLERQYQNEVVALFLKKLKYKYLGNLQYAKGAKVNCLGRANSPIIESEVEAYLADAGYTAMQIEGAMFQLKRTVRLADKRMVTLMDVSNDVYDLLPVSVILQEYFSAEMAAIAEAEQTVANKAQLIDSFLEEQQELFDNFEKVNESVIKKAVKDAAKLNFGKDDVDTFKKYLDLCKEKKEASKALSDLQAALTDKVLARYAALGEEDIRRLVVEKKWMCSVLSSCMEEMQQVTQQLSAAITAVSARYERTLPSLEADAQRYEEEVNGYLKEMGFIL